MKKFTKDYVLNYTTEGKTKEELQHDVAVSSNLLRKDFTSLEMAEALYEVGKKAMSELFTRYGDFALWSTAYVNDLPDSSFAWIELGGSKDKDGKTTPRSLRHLPYKDAEGGVDMSHLRNALARLNQVKDRNSRKISDSLQKSIRAKLEKVLAEQKKDMEDFEDDEFAVARLFGHPTGKMWFLKPLLKVLPDHKKFVEPFAGSATIYFGKKPEESAVLNDIGDYATMLHFVKNLTDAEIKALTKKNWKSSPKYFKSMVKYKPSSKLERIYRFMYVQRFSYGCMQKTYDWTSEGMYSTLRKPERWVKARDRLKNATITKEDYKECIKKHDSPDTVFYLDPPYYDLKDSRTKNMGIGMITIEDFIAGCKLIRKGKFIATVGYGNDWAKRLKAAGFHVYYAQAGRQVTTRYYKTGGSKKMTVPIISNFPVTTTQVKHDAEKRTMEHEDTYKIYMCPSCGCTRQNEDRGKVVICPNCGNKMDIVKTTLYEFTEGKTETVEVHSVDFMDMSTDNPNWLEISGILFHRGNHKGVVYEDEVLKTARLVPRSGENLCYVNFYHKKDEAHRVGLMAEIWWDPNVAWFCPNNNIKGKGALMYRSFVTDKDAIAEIKGGKISNVSAELHFDTYKKQNDTHSHEYAAHVEVNGEAITSSPALKAADIDTICTMDSEGNRSCKTMKKGQIK